MDATILVLATPWGFTQWILRLDTHFHLCAFSASDHVFLLACFIESNSDVDGRFLFYLGWELNVRVRPSAVLELTWLILVFWLDYHIRMRVVTLASPIARWGMALRLITNLLVIFLSRLSWRWIILIMKLRRLILLRKILRLLTWNDKLNILLRLWL